MDLVVSFVLKVQKKLKTAINKIKIYG